MNRRNRTNGERNLAALLDANLDSYERGNLDGDRPLVINPQAKLAQSKYNPPFDAQFDINIQIRYFTNVIGTPGVYLATTAANVLATQPTLATRLAAFVFGNSDFASGFAKLRAQFPVQVWSYESPFVYGNGAATSAVGGNFNAAIFATLQVGDLVQPFSATFALNWLGLVIIRCTQVGYGTLLDSTSSQGFVINLIRYIQNDVTAPGLTQYNNQIGYFKLSIFGKFDSDFVSPTSMKSPENFQAGVIDIPLTKNINKDVSLGTYINYDSVNIQWSVFVATVQRDI